MSFIEISKKNYFYNLDILCEKLCDKNRLAVVLKDNAYGHGLVIMAGLSAEYGISKAIVRTSDEAKQIKSYFKSIIILTPSDSEENYSNFSFVINNLSQIEKLPKNAKVHLKIDTGMHRSGISNKELAKAYNLIEKNSLVLKAVMTHFRSADELSSELFWQQKNWQKVKEEALKLTQKYNYNIPLFHSANSATLLRSSNYEDDFARCGIATFGYHQMPSSYNMPKFKPVLSLWAEKITTLNLKKGQRVGYGGAFIAKKDMKISTYDIGYGDGFFRHCNEGMFLGKVSMDSCAIEGDAQKVCILNDASQIANRFDTISYDILVKLSPTIKRVITH